MSKTILPSLILILITDLIFLSGVWLWDWGIESVVSLLIFDMSLGWITVFFLIVTHVDLGKKRADRINNTVRYSLIFGALIILVFYFFLRIFHNFLTGYTWLEYVNYVFSNETFYMLSFVICGLVMFSSNVRIVLEIRKNSKNKHIPTPIVSTAIKFAIVCFSFLLIAIIEDSVKDQEAFDHSLKFSIAATVLVVLYSFLEIMMSKRKLKLNI